MKHNFVYNKKSKTAFTLIELMVVVAVIAILATLGVTNFTAAIKRSRNASRQADIQAVAKALETCYDVPSGVYTSLPTTGTDQSIPITGATTGPFSASSNPCLNDNIRPSVANYLYTIKYKTAPPQEWVVCAELEKVANWGSVGNTATLPTGTARGTLGAACSDGSGTGADKCFYCVFNQQ